MADFRTCLELTLREEGGYSDHPADPGGKTMWGITDAVYQGYLVRMGKPSRPVAQIGRAEMEEIYRSQYWTPIHGDDLPQSAAIMLFDIAVNSGPKWAGKMAQTALGILVDGVIGNGTIGAISEACMRGREGEFIERLSAVRQNFYQRLPTFRTFGKGWTSRNRRVTSVALQHVDDAIAKLGDLPSSTPFMSYNPKDAASAVPQPLAQATNAQGAVGVLAGGGGIAGAAMSQFGSVSDWVQTNLGLYFPPRYLLLVVCFAVACVAGYGWYATRKARLAELKQTEGK